MDGSFNIETYKTCSPRELRGYLADCIEVGLVPFVRGSPGIGKSEIVRSVSDDFDLELIDERLSTRSPVDLAGLPDIHGEGDTRMASFRPFDVFPLDDRPIPKGKNGWTIFLDEFNSAQKSVQAAAYKLVLDRAVGMRKLHPNTAIVCAGNLATDRAITNEISTALQSRLIHFELEANFPEWLQDVALKRNYDPRLIAYLNYNPDKLLDFRADHNEFTFCCPRTWDFMNRLVSGKEVNEKKTKLYSGAITSGVAVDFVNYTKVFANIPNLRDVLNDPDNMFIPVDGGTRWAVTSHLLSYVTEDNLEKLSKYMSRFPTEFRILFFRSVIIRNRALKSHPAYVKAISQLSRYLNSDD